MRSAFVDDQIFRINITLLGLISTHIFFHRPNQAMTGISNVLVKKGYVERVYDDTNRRQIELHLTRKGQEFVNRRGDEVVAAISRIFSDLSFEELETIERTSTEIYSILDKTAFGKKYKYKKEIEESQKEEHK